MWSVTSWALFTVKKKRNQYSTEALEEKQNLKQYIIQNIQNTTLNFSII